MRLAVISPHLDDAVLGCGGLLEACPGSVVVTVFAGRPVAYPELTSWDARAGFGPDDDVVAARREEDRAALTLLGARPAWLPFPDPQYGPRPTTEAVADALERTLGQVGAGAVAMPLGLFHDDHQLVHAAALDVLRRRPSLAWFAYEEAIYRRLPDLVDERLEALGRDGIAVGPATVSEPGRDVKRRAVECYRSQLQALAASWEGGYADAFAPERYWSLALAASTQVGVGRRDEPDGR